MDKSVVVICDEPDSSVIEVLDWIDIEDSGVHREVLSLSDFINSSFLQPRNILNNSFSLNPKEKLSIMSLWFRRTTEPKYPLGFKIAELKDIDACVEFDYKALRDIVIYLLERNCNLLSSYQSFYLNKSIVLHAAIEIGLCVPSSKICSNKEELKQFTRQNQKIILKSIGENLTLLFDNNTKALKQYVVEIDDKMLKDLPEKFFPTLFQQRIDKQMDLRIFYLEGKFFPMAIFSQCLDFREDYQNHRNVPIKLPEDLEKKLHQLMQKLDLNTGSIDMVRCAKTKKYYFLEVNPNGQFGMVSKPCNYYLEREIAEFLTT